MLYECPKQLESERHSLEPAVWQDAARHVIKFLSAEQTLAKGRNGLPTDGEHLQMPAPKETFAANRCQKR